MCLRKCKAVAHSMHYGCSTLKRGEVTSKFPRLLLEAFAVLQGKKEIKFKKKRKIENINMKKKFWKCTD